MRRILVVWIVLSVIAVPLVIWVLGPHLPPGHMSTEASDQTNANTVMTALMTPIVLLLAVVFVYSLAVFRARGGAIEDGAPIYGDNRIQTTWLVVTSVIVIGLAVWGSYTLLVSAHGAGGGQGPNPIATPPGYKDALQVQVIGQQWNWTYRFPGYGAVETDHLELPNDTAIAFHVTSLDVTHSFWAYQLGVKADAVPGTDNVAFVHPRKLGSFSIRCSELCGLWHGHMFQTGQVVTPAQFAVWIAAQQHAQRLNQRFLPPYAKVYYPEPLRRAG
jgi:cytochrome c oxidase subunit 2